MQQDKTSNFTFFQWDEFGPSAGLTAGLGSVRVSGMWTCERGHQKPALLAFDARNPPCPLDSPHKGSIMRKVCWYDDIIILPICPFLCIYTHFAYLTRWSLGNVVEILKTYFSTITPHPSTPTPMKLGLVVFLDYWIHHVSSHWCHHKKYPSVCPPVDGMVCGA